MQLVRCKSIRETNPIQIQKGKLYWLDEASLDVDNDGDEFAVIYADVEGTQYVGVLNTKHFIKDYQYVKLGMSLNAFVNNEEEGVLLEDILGWCEKQPAGNTLASNVLKYIKDKGIDTEENRHKEYFIKSMPIAAFEHTDKPSDYVAYMGYSVSLRK